MINIKVNFAGLTTERARSGKQSYKLDITFIKGWQITIIGLAR